MKKRFDIIKIAGILFMAAVLAACSNNYNTGSESTVKNTEENENSCGEMTVRLFVPDYYKMSGTRAVAPQTAAVKFGYYNSKTSSWVTHSTAALDMSTAEDITDKYTGVCGQAYTLSFSKIPSKNYAAGTLKIELLDESGTVITSGTNKTVVSIIMGETTTASIFTTPVSSTNESGSLIAGQMKFLKKELFVGKHYSLSVCIDASDTSYPDLVIFNKNGIFNKYISVDNASEATIDFDDVTESTIIYIGIYADDDIDVTQYNLVFTVKGTLEGAIDVSTLNEEGFGTSSEFSSDWTLTGTDSSNPILVENGNEAGDGYAVSFRYQSLGTGTASLSRSLILNEDSLMKFAVKTDIYYKYDGYLEFYIDDVLMDSFTGMNGSWTTLSYLLKEGSHTITWKSVGASNSYTATNITWTVCLADLNFKIYTIPAAVDEDFESTLDDDMWSFGGLAANISTDEVLEGWAQYGDAVKDTHGNVVKLCYFDGSAAGDSYLVLNNIKVNTDSCLTFEYRTDLYTDYYAYVSVDGEKLADEYAGSGKMWLKASIPLDAGEHTIKWVLPKYDFYYPVLKNAIYIDNITLAADEIASVDISPKGLQETYVDGNKIQFTGTPLRSDGSEINGKSVVWTCTGGTIDETGLFTPGSESGTYTVTATVDGKSASNTTVKIHGDDYLKDSVTLNGEEYTGYSGVYGTGNTGTVNFSDCPLSSSFSADGFFTLKGTVTNSQASNNAFVQIKSGNYETFYLLKDDFYTRIWLRFGSDNEYTITVYDLNNISFEGACYTGCSWTSSNCKTWTVTNSHTETAENAVYLMPSYFCQSDDFVISNAVNDVLAGLDEDADVGQKLQALHNWEIRRMHYDYDSLNTYRKLQDAVSVVNNKTGVCEGYANLFASLARSIGVKTRYQSSRKMVHGWVQCLYNDEYKLVDVTWDDPAKSDDSLYEDYPYDENYEYFLIDTTGVSNDHYGDVSDSGRAAVIDPVKPWIRDMPDGWY